MWEHWHYIVFSSLWYGSWITGVLLLGLIIRKLNERGRGVSEEEKLDKRRTQGGIVFNDLLEDLRRKLEPMKREFIEESISRDSQEERRKMYEHVKTLEDALCMVARMLNMKEPE